MTYNVLTTRQSQVVIDQSALVAIQTDLARRIADLERLRVAIETLAQVNEPDRFAAAAMALCNQLAARWRAERVSLGFLKGRYVRLMALSHTEKFTRQMRLVQDIEASMEECLDQDVEILFPPPADAAYVSRASESLAQRHGPNVICSLPMRRKGDVVAVLTLERKADKVFSLEEVETLRLTCDLVTPRLVNLYEQDRWFGAKAARALRKGLAFVVGPKHTWIKAAAIAILAFGLFTILAKGRYRVESPFSFEATEKQVIPAPFDGYLKSVRVAAGDWVLSQDSAATLRAAGGGGGLAPNPFALGCFDSTLAALDTDELETQLISSRAERLSYMRQRDKAMSEDKIAEVQIHEASIEKLDADIRLLESRIARAALQSPIDGVVFTGDLKQKIGTKLNTGDVLFEVGRLEQLRAELAVPEDEIPQIKVGCTGELATSSYPEKRIKFTVERISPVAEVVKEKNVYKVRAAIEPGELQTWMRPGMDGISKVDVGRERYAWLWTHRLVNWVRMKLWL